jgi:hypothetical protein
MKAAKRRQWADMYEEQATAWITGQGQEPIAGKRLSRRWRRGSQMPEWIDDDD